MVFCVVKEISSLELLNNFVVNFVSLSMHVFSVSFLQSLFFIFSGGVNLFKSDV